MKKPKHKILVEYIEKIVLTSPLCVKKVYSWMNHEGANLFYMREVEQEFFKENKIYSRNDICVKKMILEQRVTGGSDG